MEHNQRELRRLAARAFLESLDQLQATLEASEQHTTGLSLHRAEATRQLPKTTTEVQIRQRVVQPASQQPAKPSTTQSRTPKPAFTFQDLEQAVADIEQYMSHQNTIAAGSQPED